MNLHRAVSRTVSYARFFHFPITASEIHFWLVSSKKVPIESLNPFIPSELSSKEKSFRQSTLKFSEQKNDLAKKLAAILKFVPGLRFLGLTGSVAAKNAQQNDDIDLFFITSPNTLWLVRPFVLFLISFFFRRRHPGESHSKAANAFCPNLWLDSLSVSIPRHKQNLYTAHEVLQVVPLFNKSGTYEDFLQQNRWTKKYLANAYSALSAQNRPYPPVYHLSSTISKLILIPLNSLFYLIQFLYMYPKKTKEIVSLHSAYLHTTDFSSALDKHLDDI